MDNSKDKELDSYGVWVKRNVSNEESIDLTLDDDTFADLPDLDESTIFDDSDFSDMFKDNDVFNTEKNNIFVDNDSTFTNNDFENVTNEVQSEEIELNNTIEDSTDSLTMDDIQFDDNSIDMNLDNFTDINESSEEVKIQDPEIIDMNFDDSTDIFTEEFTDFDIKQTEIVKSEDPVEEETSISLDGVEEEISLDDFMDEGFSDDSVAAGNNGYEPGKEPKPAASSETEEISLDDFVDFMEETPKETQADEIIDEKPLEMEINFDDSVESVETEDNTSVVSSNLDDDFDFEETTEAVESYEPKDNLFSNDSTSSDKSMDNFIESEEVDLSDFGIDANAEETAVTQDVEASKAKEIVIDYDLSVGEEENLSSAPVVNEIKDKKEDETLVQQTVPEGSTVVETSLLQQIVADLSSLKNEINTLKKDLSDLSTEKSIPQPEVTDEIEIPEEDTTTSGGFFDSDDTDDTIALSGDELENIMNSADFTEEEQSSSEVETPTPSINDIEEDFDSTTVVIPEEPQIEETSVEIDDKTIDFDIESEDEVSVVASDEVSSSENDTILEESVLEDSLITENENNSVDFDNFDDENTEENISINEDDTISEESIENEINIEEESEKDSTEEFDNSFALPNGIELSNDNATDEIILSSDSEDEVPVEDEISDETFETEVEIEQTNENVTEETIEDDFSIDDDLDFTFNENLDETEESLPEEISIPTEESDDIELDDMFVESSETDFIDESISDDEDFASLNMSDVSEQVQPDSTDEPSFEAFDEESDIEDVLETPNIIEESTEETIQDTSVNFEDAITDTFEENSNSTIETNVSDVEIPSFEENIDDYSSQEIENEDFAEATSDVPTVSEILENANKPTEEATSINSTFEENKTSSPMEQKETDSSETGTDLRSEIKSVLLYMDQLLENLPEDKIMEFAKSDEFTTYKKLFSELGLS